MLRGPSAGSPIAYPNPHAGTHSVFGTGLDANRGRTSVGRTGLRARSARRASATRVRLGDWTLRVVKRGGFAVLPRRWVVERTFAWVGPQPPAREDFEATIASALAWLMVASIQLLVRRLANP